MSTAASQLESEFPAHKQPEGTVISKGQEEHERAILERLAAISPPSSGPVIAVDLDDVLSQTNQVVAEWHNEKYGTNMDLSSFYYYYYWKNPFWGTPKETFDKVKEFYSTDLIFNTKPVPGAREGVQSLRNMGYRLIIVTARPQDHADESWNWVNRHFPGIFDSVICTSQFKDALKSGHGVATKLSKAQVCTDLGAKLLIDDSAENAVQCVSADPLTPVLLFGEYQWNKRVCDPSDARDEMTFDIRLEAEGGREFWRDSEGELGISEDAPLFRVKDWAEVVRWIQKAREEGRI